jgi:hypothetical protein
MLEITVNLFTALLLAVAAESGYRAWREAGYPTLEEL